MSKRRKATKGSDVRAAIVGLGMGWNHIEPFRRHPRCEVVAVCDVDAEKVEQARKKFNIEHGFTSHEDLLDFDGFDIAAIVLPNDLHEPIGIEFLKRGKHVLMEKPLALNAAQGRRIVEAAKQAGVTAAMHMNQRMCPEHQLIRRAVESGELGDLHYIRTGWMRRRGIPTGAGSWFVRKERAGGGPLIDLGVHMLDSALYFADFPRVLSVSGRTNRHPDPDATASTRRRSSKPRSSNPTMDVEDFAIASIRCEGGLTIHLEVSWASYHDDPNEAFMHVYGTRGGAHRRTRFDLDWNASTEFCFSRERLGALMVEQVDAWPVDFKTVQEDLVDAILDNREPVCTLEQGLVILKVLDAVYASASKDGGEVRLTR